MSALIRQLRFACWAALTFLALSVQPAAAQTLEKLVMPGRVIASHAEFEGECAACHGGESEENEALDDRCIACHETVGEDRLTGRGFHGRFEAADQSECVACHTDHEGRDADIVLDNAGYFDHDFSDFPLAGAHQSVSCADCHEAETPRRYAPSGCVDCHAGDDTHDGELGADCASCHNAQTWADTDFDHSNVGYLLTGQHADVACADCHSGNAFEDTPTQCANCHAVDDIHGGSNGEVCNDCHTTETWATIGFNHAVETGFALTQGHGGLSCEDCHTREDFQDGLTSACAGCHLSDDDHQGINGEDCESCHEASDWSSSLFDHADTAFELHDAHADLNCSGCHKDSVETELPLDCGGCHALDDNHLGQLGGDCATCHAQTDWHANIAFDHDLSSFPLTGMHATVSCEGCHASEQFHDAPTGCVDCHAGDDAHEGSLGTDCAGCHTSNEWPVAEFDHGQQTGFALDGSHAALGCADCHRDPAAPAGDVPSTCGGCHRPDDVHEGQFGMQCAQCHNSTTFSDVERF